MGKGGGMLGIAPLGCCAFELLAGLFVFFLAVAIIIGGDSVADTNDDSTLPNGVYSDAGGDLANADAMTKEQIECFLQNHPSGYNLLPYAGQIYEACQKFNINPLLSLAMANKDSSLGTAGAGEQCMNPGNIQNRSDNYSPSGITASGNCEDIYGGAARWAAFKNYGDGMQAKIWLLRTEYLDKGYDTVEKIVTRYAPPNENDTTLYIKQVNDFINNNTYKEKCGF